MEVQFKKKFLKDLDKVPSNIREKIKDLVFKVFPESSDFLDIPNIKYNGGYSDYYRIRQGDYRIGFHYSEKDSIVTFYRVLHRKDIYKKFP